MPRAHTWPELLPKGERKGHLFSTSGYHYASRIFVPTSWCVSINWACIHTESKNCKWTCVCHLLTQCWSVHSLIYIWDIYIYTLCKSPGQATKLMNVHCAVQQHRSNRYWSYHINIIQFTLAEAKINYLFLSLSLSVSLDILFAHKLHIAYRHNRTQWRS